MLDDQDVPLVSVVMPVYNGGKFITEAIESILCQTYQHFELIIVDDNSKDNSLELLEALKNRFPEKITLINLPKTLDKSGDCATNIAIKKAKGKYIAKMDADDVSSPLRLEKQVEFLENNPHIFLVGTQAHVINKEGNPIGEKNNPISHNSIYSTYFLYNCIIHPSIMFRNEFKTEDFYEVKFPCFNEYWTFFKYMNRGKQFANLSDYLLFYRLHGKNDTFTNIKKKFRTTLAIKKSFIVDLGYKPSVKQLVITLLQSIVVFSMPEKTILYCYLIFRNVIPLQSLFLRFRTTKIPFLPSFQSNN